MPEDDRQQSEWRSAPLLGRFETLLGHLLSACQQVYGKRLVSLVVYGSVGRKSPRPDSDVDLLIVAEDLPDGRLRRMEEFRRVEEEVSQAAQEGMEGEGNEISPFFKTPAEVLQGSPLFLDMVEDARLLFDKDGFMEQVLSRFKERLRTLGAHRIWRGNAWVWDLKPDYRPGEVFEL